MTSDPYNSRHAVPDGEPTAPHHAATDNGSTAQPPAGSARNPRYGAWYPSLDSPQFGAPPAYDAAATATPEPPLLPQDASPFEWQTSAPPRIAPPPTFAGWSPPVGQFVPATPPTRAGRGRLAGIAIVVGAVALVAAVVVVGSKVLFGHSTPTGTRYESAAGRFAARFTDAPEEQQRTIVRSGRQINVVLAMDEKGQEIVGEVTVNPGLPSGRDDAELLGFISGFAGAGKVESTSTTTFQGHRALTATGVFDGATVHALVVMYSSEQIYMLLAGTDANLKNLEDSFEATP